MLGKELIWFRTCKKNKWCELYVRPVTFSELFPILADIAAGDNIFLLQFSTPIDNDPLKAIKGFGVSDIELIDPKAGLCIFPKKELLKFKDVLQNRLSLVDIKTKPSIEALRQIDMSKADTDLTQYSGIFFDLGSNVLFASQDDRQVSICLRNERDAKRCLEYIVRSFFRTTGMLDRGEVTDELISGLLERASCEVMVSKDDTELTEKCARFVCRKDGCEEYLDAFEVTVEGKKVAFSPWEKKLNPAFQRKNYAVYILLGAAAMLILIILSLMRFK